MRSRFSSTWLFVVVATALLLGVAVVAAQNGPQGPNDESGPERGEALSTIRTQTQKGGPVT